MVPLQYAIAQSTIAFWLSLYTNQMPYMGIGNRNPESAGSAKAQTLVNQYQLEQNAWPLQLYQILLDGLRYGIGAINTEWAIDEVTQTTRSVQQIQVGNQVIDVPFTEKRQVVEYEGNKLRVVDTCKWWPD